MVLAAALMAALSMGAASAQDYEPDRYDGRRIAGWSYEPELSDKGNPTWVLADGSSGRDGANCNVRVAPADGSREQWSTYFSSLTAESFGAEIATHGMQPEPGNRVEVMSVQGRPAMRHFMTSTVQGERFDFVSQMVSGADALLTITCAVQAGQMAVRLPAFEGFLGGLAILTSPAR